MCYALERSSGRTRGCKGTRRLEMVKKKDFDPHTRCKVREGKDEKGEGKDMVADP